MAAVTRRQYKGAAASTTITAALTNVATTTTLTAITGWPSTASVPFYVVIDPGNSSEEKCSATISGSTLTLTRGADDTTAVAHSSGATIYPVFSADEADEANNMAATMTTKGDLLVTDGSAFNRLAVGTNAHVLTADSAATNGVKWALSPETDLVTTKGDILVASAADTLARQAVGSNGQVLVADSGVTNGVAWVDPQTNRNVVINGGFDVWQRPSEDSSGFFADRWARNIPSSGVQSKETDVPTAQYAYSWKHLASATNSYMQCGQQIEYQNCKQFQNQVTTISFWAKAVNANAGSTTLSVRTRTIAGVDGACRFSGTNVDTAVTLTTSWAKYTVARTMPATFGSASIEFGLGSHLSGDGFFLTGLQWELGSVATPFEFENYGTTLLKCQRYYHDNINILTVCANGGYGNSYTAAMYFPIEMRATPTITTYSGASFAGTAGQATWHSSGAGTAANVSFESASALGYSLYRSGTATSLLATFSYTASIEL